jgi:hypothetical protein
MKKYVGCLVLGLTLFLIDQPAFAQTDLEFQVLKKEIESLKEGQAGIKKDLQEIKKLIQSFRHPPAADEFKQAIIDIKGAPIKGNKNAKLVLMEFSDYQ